MPTPNNLINTTQLRAEIGGPTADITEPGGVTDAQLQSIIDRNTSALDDIFETRMSQANFDDIPQHLFQPVDIASISTSGDNPLVAEGTINETTYYPIANQVVDDNGKLYSYDPQLFLTARIAFTDVRRYMIVDDRIYVLPKTITDLEVWLSTQQDLYDFIMGDLLSQINNQIINEAKQMLASRIQEGIRLNQGISEIDND